jgi:hypothetical protein
MEVVKERGKRGCYRKGEAMDLYQSLSTMN